MKHNIFSYIRAFDQHRRGRMFSYIRVSLISVSLISVFLSVYYDTKEHGALKIVSYIRVSLISVSLISVFDYFFIGIN